MNSRSFDLDEMRRRLSTARGKEYWRSLEELADSEAFKRWMHEEMPRHAAAWTNALDRRDFLKLMGASLALAGLAGCRNASPAPNDEKIVPYVIQPEEIVPGKALYFATAMPLAGFGRGVLVESHMGRPIKIEGNPKHPASLGATDVFMQASVLDLYDPDRSPAVGNAGVLSNWSAFLSPLNGQLALLSRAQGEGLFVLTETVTSPTLKAQLDELLNRLPKAKWHQYDPVGRDGVYDGARLAFGEPVETLYRFDRAAVILSIDADFLFFGPGAVRYARDFSNKRRVGDSGAKMNRLYMVETMPTVTGSMADHRLPLSPSGIEAFARVAAASLGVGTEAAKHELPSEYSQWLGAAVRDLQQHRGNSIVIAGEHQPAAVHQLAHAMNQALGNVGSTVVYTDPVAANPINQAQSLRDIAKAMESGAVRMLVIIGGNPVYTAPADVKFGALLPKANFTVHLSSYEDETSALCRWHIPAAHYLESWSDVRAFDGTASIIQPLIAPLYGGKTSHEFIAAMLGDPQRSAYDIVREYWRGQSRAQDFERFWRSALHEGVIPGTALPAKTARLSNTAKAIFKSTIIKETETQNPKPETSLEVIFRPDPTVLDGRFANNGWLQETPKPLTKLTWDNAVIVSPVTAERLGLSHTSGGRGGEHGTTYADVVELSFNGRQIRAPAWILPGHADNCVTVHLGYGRARAGRVGGGAGFNAGVLRTMGALWHGAGAQIRKTGEQSALACTQLHHLMEGRELARSASLQEYRKNPSFVREKEHEPPHASLYPGFKHEGYAWGMAIDVNSCIGCNACVVGCVAENNIPVVGKKEVMRGREMHWIRIDRYYQGPPDNPETLHQPVPCMQCENAPCELVCPVHATTHSEEGLNDMTYNRCVGTRYCSNNCPYKVRRFNFFQYADFKTPSLKLLHNPDVTVRSRGVMEKCTYCVQRINQAKIEAEKQDRKVADGEIMTACQQACPTQAIVFGDINDPNSRVSKIKAGSLNYTLLDELNTRPRTSYQAKLKNPNPEIERT